ncbi:cysteine desulfurase-like protein (plasmid) [Deinococcus psychrotolerans]|uniref:Cysteine desulfurase-like protein n=1 Tax=Deinococcus psychrotolerans TaxID=2489213 RepID=A0A3G8YTJ6_9DEIO|nr:cysteine desulfurase-like protein [Deinococcus psychrotolerans]AZI45031.1 cysteine desulfurase-like protein [Deinococcus psychrotolerans]
MTTLPVPVSPTVSPLEPHLGFIRSQFPALDSPWAFFDNAGGSQVLRGVAERVSEYLTGTSVQLGASYAVSQEASARVAAGVQAAAHFVNAADPREVVLGGSSTQLVANLASSMGEFLKAGDEIIITDTDHEANVGAWTRLESRGIKTKIWKIDTQTLQLDLNTLGTLMTDRTRLVCFTHVSNVLGTINPVPEITRFVHQRGAKVFVDGVAYAPHRMVDVQAWDVDYYLFSWYKVYGPHISLLFGKLENLLELPSINHFFVSPDAAAYRLQPGNLNYELTYGLTGVTDYMSALQSRLGVDSLSGVFDAFAAHEAVLAGRLLEYLATKPNVRVIGHPLADPSARVDTISFVVDGVASSELPKFLDGQHIAVRYGHFYAYRLIQSLGLDQEEGVVRVSMAHYNTLAEVDRLIAGLEAFGL